MIKVLVVDDENLVRQGIIQETGWDSLGCQVVGEAANGLEALDAVHNLSPDLIISDIHMPKLGGIEMLRRIREEGNQVSVIFLTAYSEFSYAQEALRLMAVDYVLKPFEDGELEKAVEKIVKNLKDAENLAAEAESEKDDISKKIVDEVLVSVESKANKSRYVQETLAYIRTHYGDMDISVGSIAQELGISEGHLSHLFKKETDCTIMAYLTRYRMQEARKLLDDCRNKVYEVAEQVGYRDLTYFSSTFKKIVGMSPSEYQRR